MVSRNSSEFIMVIIAMMVVAVLVLIGFRALETYKQLESMRSIIQKTELKVKDLEDFAENYGYYPE